jgi:beta-glucosidase
MPWINKAKAVLQCWYPGQEFGNALFDVVMGNTNPSGKLPTSFPKRLEDTPAFKFYPGEDLQMNYEEDLLVGYKWYQRQNIATLYPFGYGLSYTSFEYSELSILEIDDCTYRCTFSIKNTGKVDGSEVTQCYVGLCSADLDEPIKTLQGFDKVFIESGKEITVEIILNERNFAQWDTATKSWEIRTGSYEISIGASVEDIRLSSEVTL